MSLKLDSTYKNCFLIFKLGRVFMDRNLVNKGLSIWLSGKFFFRDAVSSLERARGSILLVRVATYSAGHMLKLRKVAQFGRKLEKRKLSSTFSDQLFCARFAKKL